ncbi:hypothetical protein KTH_50160 [Thermosporothrix hazakensis]|uniref:Uncharacterized protein n=1 Tax=Thermosporothrix sp. COM3 TaxID=2490863 RepID=A0A455SL70_9CHLR|nr:hypothetical protein KTC_24600 [Thermosporothrix sp. COM3]GCE50147.1 hypothetical protein KTH_50160 [Thermosporothrix hazakensis]
MAGTGESSNRYQLLNNLSRQIQYGKRGSLYGILPLYYRETRIGEIPLGKQANKI